MNAPLLVDAPYLFPGRCLFCSRSKGAMVDTQIEDPGLGRVYACVDVCAPTFARLAGWADPAVLADAEATVQALRDQLADADQAVEQAAGDAASIAEAAAARALELARPARKTPAAA
jgi:hypothetical protein